MTLNRPSALISAMALFGLTGLTLAALGHRDLGQWYLTRIAVSGALLIVSVLVAHALVVAHRARDAAEQLLAKTDGELAAARQELAERRQSEEIATPRLTCEMASGRRMSSTIEGRSGWRRAFAAVATADGSG